MGLRGGRREAVGRWACDAGSLRVRCLPGPWPEAGGGPGASRAAPPRVEAGRAPTTPDPLATMRPQALDVVRLCPKPFPHLGCRRARSVRVSVASQMGAVALGSGQAGAARPR